MTVPLEYEGTKTDTIALTIAIEEIARAFPALAVIISVHCSLFCYALDRFGNEDQKKKYLPRAAKGEILGAFSLSEPGAGSDATNLNTKAQKEGNYYVLNGIKNWITTGSEADAIVLFAVSGKISGKNELSAFIIDRDTPGLKVSKIEEKMGIHASLTAELTLEDCKVPAENLLGKEGDGTTIAFICLDHSRIGIAAQALGISERSLEEAVLYSKQREAFGQKIADLQAIQFMLADMATLLDAARLLTYRAANLYDNGKRITKESSMAKLFAAEAANKIVYQALQIHGGYGYSKEFPIEQLYRDARVLPIYEGTSEIQRLVIARNLLK
jgi:alkylation response protein AidB-like acyl-CoA dehydrogenase